MIDFYLLPPNIIALHARQEKGGSKNSIVSISRNLQLLISVAMNRVFYE